MYVAAMVINTVHVLQVKNLLDEVEFIFVPFANPDGYEVSA
jgi:murein tripeptide amidase MpaA